MSQDAIVTVDPTTGARLDTYPYMSDEEASATVDACHAAFLQWRDTTLEERADALRRLAGSLRERVDEFAALMTREVGKLIGDARGEVELCAQICEYTADQGPRVLADEIRAVDGFQRGIITYAPMGVIYGIQPWNFPCYQAVRYSVASLMAGNGVLLKHAPNCTGSGRYLTKLYAQAGFPEGLVSQLIISESQSDEIIAHDKVRGVTLTGSDKAGRIVAQKAAAEIKKTVMELGSNDAYLVLEDADLDTAVKVCVQGRLTNNGETCINAKRIVVTAALYERFLEQYVDAMRDVKMGDPSDESTQLGPIARRDLLETLADQVEESVSKGAKILCGGAPAEGEGFFYPATVLAHVQPGQPAYDDELFGPVASVIKARDDEDAMRIANDSRYGLGGGIITQDEDKAIALAKGRFDTGMIFINGFGLASPNMPFGGVKDSGYGNEHGGFGMREFVNVKSIYVG